MTELKLRFQRLLACLSLAAALMNMSTLVLNGTPLVVRAAGRETPGALARCRFPNYRGLLDNSKAKVTRTSIAGQSRGVRRTAIQVNSRCCPRAAANCVASIRFPTVAWSSASCLTLRALAIRLQV
jgi:hypothetical protein